jgi:hypothetical protein
MTIKRINNGKGHWYKIDGSKADGVTTLIGDGFPKPSLVGWAARTVAEYVADHVDAVIGMRDMDRRSIVDALKYRHNTVSTEAAVRGTRVHALADRLAAGQEIEVPDELAGHVDSYVRFLDEWKPTTVLTETTVGSYKWRYAGTFDLIADLPDGRRILFDLKTSGSGIYPEVALQLAAYRYADVYLDGGAEKNLTDLGVTDSMVVWCRSDGYDVYHVDTSPAVFNDFLHVATVARCRKARAEGWLSEALEVPAS